MLFCLIMPIYYEPVYCFIEWCFLRSKVNTKVIRPVLIVLGVKTGYTSILKTYITTNLKTVKYQIFNILNHLSKAQ